LPPRARSQSWTSPASDPLLELERQLQACSKSHGHAETAAIYNEMGNVHFRQGNLKAAQESYKRAITCESGKHVATAYMNLGTVYWSQGDVRQALEMLEQALASHELDLLKVGKGLEDSPMAASVYHQLGLCHALKRDFGTAMTCMELAFKIRNLSGATVDVGKTVDAMGKICYLQGDFYAAQEHHKSAYRLLAASNAATETVLQNLANCYEATGDFSRAIGVWQDVAQQQRKTESAGLPETIRNMARVFEKSGLHAEAETCRQEAERL
jgi:tetratricopeptide (TPR) repeat protein